MLKSWICGGRFNGISFYICICWSFHFLVFSLLRHPQLTVERVGSFYFFLFPLVWRVVFFSPEVFVNHKRLSTNSKLSLDCLSLACVLTTWVGLTFLFRTSRGVPTNWVGGNLYCVWEDYVRRMIQSEKFLYELRSRFAFFCLQLGDFCYSFEFWAVSWEGLVVCYAVVAFDLGTSALMFVVSLIAAPCTRYKCFTVPLHSVPIFRTSLAAHWYFIIFVSFSFCLFSRDIYESWWFFFVENH